MRPRFVAQSTTLSAPQREILDVDLQLFAMHQDSGIRTSAYEAEDRKSGDEDEENIEDDHMEHAIVGNARSACRLA